MNHWLLKSEPSSFGIDDLAALPRRTAAWDGVRNYQARNMLRDSMKKGDTAFFYHSSCEVPGIAGIVRVVRNGYPDPTAFQPAHHYYDAKSRPGDPRWFAADVRLERKLKQIITLDTLRSYEGSALSDLILLKRGSRLSVMPVTQKDWEFILTLE